MDHLFHTPVKRLLILSTYYSGGGAALMARQTLEGVRALGVDARMLVASPLPPDAPDYVQSVGGAKWHLFRYAEKLQTIIYLKGNRKKLFRISTASLGITAVLDHPWVKWAETINIHWVQQSFLSLRDLRKLCALPDKKILWTLHDYWALTGGCHSPYLTRGKGDTELCERFLSECGKCPILSRNPHDPNDLSRKLLEEKKSWSLERITFLAVSKRTEDYARKSTIGKKATVIFQPNFFDPTLFFPKKGIHRRKRILFVAARPDDPVKGLDLAKEALRIATEKNGNFASDFTFTIVGTLKEDSLLRDSPIPLELVPRITRQELADLYRSSTLTLSSSRMETFGLTLLESIACGTPVVSFSIDKPSTFMKEGENCSLAEPFDTVALASAILCQCYPLEPLSPDAVARTVADFRQDTVLRKFIEL